MKKIIIGSLVGAILLFGWQSASWMVMGIHEKAMKHTTAQDSILSVLSNSLTEEGQYLLPNMPVGTPHSEMEEFMKKNEGRPWAVINYHKAHKMDMVMPIIRAFLICLVCMWLCCLVIGKMTDRRFYNVFTTTLTFGLISFLSVWYMGHNWMSIGWDVLTGELIDNIAGWGLAGIWLGWWYGQK
ncbi:MAG: hypothetical protein WBO39_06135 [Ferruginibacter sp.]